VGRIHARGHDERGQGGEHASIDVYGNMEGLHSAAGQDQRLPIAANREHVAAEFGVVEQQPGDNENHKRC
jgi:hypothetical protein